MSRPAPRTLEVIRSSYLTPNMLRVTLGGSGLADFPEDQESAYVKLILPQPGEGRSLTRTYTVSAQRSNEIDLDFVLHAAESPASSWALGARPGDKILVGGPGPKRLINLDADWFLIVGDMTALPAIRINLASLPEGSRGYAVIEVGDKSDIQSFHCPKNIGLHWVLSASATMPERALLDRIEQLPWLPGQVAVWAACEFHSMRALRKYFKVEREVSRDKLYISSYWKSGSTEDQHKIEKQTDTREAQQ